MAYPKKGEIYRVNFDPTIRHEVKKKRPALIISLQFRHNFFITQPPQSTLETVFP